MRGCFSQIEDAPMRPGADIRPLFSALQRKVNGKKLVYLDTAATALRPEMVIRSGCNFCREHDANPHRGLHTLSAEATALYEGTRDKVANWLNAPDRDCVVFTRNATAGLNMIARGVEHNILEGDEILLTEMEHHANLIPWQMLARRKGAKLRFIPVDDTGHLDLGDFGEVLNGRTKVVAFTHTSNVLGTRNPVREIAAFARKLGATIVLDAAQAVGHGKLDFGDLGVDFLVFSAHKCYGPSGLGGIIGTKRALDEMEPAEYGGEMIADVELESSTWAQPPLRFEAGTMNTSAVASFPRAIEFIESVGENQIEKYERTLVSMLIAGLEEMDGIRILGPRDPSERGGLVSFVHNAVHAHDLATYLDSEGIAVRAGHHCAQPLHKKLAVPSSIRASFGVYSVEEEVLALLDGLKSAVRFFSR